VSIDIEGLGERCHVVCWLGAVSRWWGSYAECWD
jgi:hypothetical protein